MPARRGGTWCPTRAPQTLAAAFWPGPLTWCCRAAPSSEIALLAAAGLDTLAVRVPLHPVAHALLAGVGRPVAAPSANRSGAVSPTTAAHVLDGLDGRIAAVLDAGPCAVGVESTVLDLAAGRAAAAAAGRPGPRRRSRRRSVRSRAARPTPRCARRASSPRHYAPRLPVRLGASAAGADEALLAFGPAPSAPLAFNLSADENLAEAAARLFAGLRWLDAEGQRRGLRGIAAMPVPARGLGLAINDRLARAAAPRAAQ